MHDKVNWLEWSKEAFQKSKKENKPILLSISATWCYWCHRQDSDNYSNDDVAEFINESFIPLRVDTDKRPDINERYNQGGWPSTVFLDENGNVITGATYVPPYEFLSMLGQVSELYKHRKKDIINKINAKERTDAKGVNAPKAEEIKKGELSDEIFSALLKLLIETFDISYGGFGFEPKFPMPEAVELCLINFLKSADKQSLRMATITLDSMAFLQDKVEGGFFRYSVTRDWEVPHFEKMLEGNAGIIRNYLLAYHLTKKETYKTIALHALNYIKNNLSASESTLNSNNFFYASQDADEEYYKKKLEDRQKVKPPFVDKTLYVNFNSMMLQTCLKAYMILKDKFYLEFAEKVINYILENCFSKEGISHMPGEKIYLLADHARFASALLDAYEITHNKKYLQTAEELALLMLDKFYNKGESFNDISEEGEGLLAQGIKNIAENSIAAEVFLRLSVHMENNLYRKIAQETLESFSASYQDYSIHAAQYALAAEKLLHAREIHVYGDHEIPYDPRNVVVQLTEEEAKKKGYAKKGIYLCTDGLCKYYESAEAMKENKY